METLSRRAGQIRPPGRVLESHSACKEAPRPCTRLCHRLSVGLPVPVSLSCPADLGDSHSPGPSACAGGCPLVPSPPFAASRLPLVVDHIATPASFHSLVSEAPTPPYPQALLPPWLRTFSPSESAPSLLLLKRGCVPDLEAFSEHLSPTVCFLCAPGRPRACPTLWFATVGADLST